MNDSHFFFKSQPPPQIEEIRQNEQSGVQTEKNVHEHQQPNSQQLQQNRRPSRFHQGPQPILVWFTPVSPYLRKMFLHPIEKNIFF